MADEIRQDMGFDAAQALETINQLNAGFDRLFQTLNAAPRTFDAFNQRAGKTVSALIQIKSRADQAAASLAKTTAQNFGPGTAGPGAGPSSAGQAAAAQATAAALNNVATAANQAGTATQNAGNNATNSLNRARRASTGFALSLETVVRVLSTQLIVRSLSAMQRGIEESFGSFIKFEQQLATIRTIAPEQTITQLALELSELSSAFNVPLLEVVEAKYQILQNGFESAAESSEILTASLKFARITNADVAASADLITSALNAYGRAATEAETITAKLVRTIDIGRISGNELVNAFGRIAPAGAELGVTTDELLASLSSISIAGVRASEAATQVNAAMTAFIKPSEGMQEALRKLGFETGEQAIAALGFQGAIRGVIDTTNGSTTAVGKLFRNIRAMREVFRTTGGGAEAFDRHLKDIEQTARGVLRQKFEIRIKSDAEKVTADFNKFSNFLTTEVGRSLVLTTANVIKLAGGVDNLIGAARAFLPAVGLLSAALIAYGVAVAAASARTKLLSLAMINGRASALAFAGGLTFFVTAAIAAKKVGEEIGQVFTRSLNAGRLEAEEGARLLLQDQKEKDAAQSQLDAQSNRKRLQQINQFIAAERRAYTEQAEIARVSNDQLLADTESTLDRIVEAHDRFAQDLKRAAQDAEAQVLDSQRRSEDARIRLLDERFNRENEKLSEQSQLRNQQQRAEQIATAAQKQLLTANTDEQVKAAQAAFDRSEIFQREALATAKSLGVRSQIFQVERRIEQLAQSRIRAEEKFQRIRASEAVRLRQEAAAEEERVGKLKTLAQEFLSKSNLFDSSGNRLPEEQVTKNVNEAKKALAEFQRLAFETDEFSIGDLFSFDSLQRRLQQSVSDSEIAQLQATPKALDSLVGQIQGQLGRTKFVVEILNEAGIDTSSLAGFSDPEALGRATELLQEQSDTLEKLRASVLKRRQLEREIAQEAVNAENSFKGQLTTGEKIARLLQRGLGARPTVKDGPGSVREQNRLEELRAKIQAGINDPSVTAEFINNLARQLQTFADGSSIAVRLDLGKAESEFNKLRDVFQKRLEIKQLNEGGATENALNAAEVGFEDAARRLQTLEQIRQLQSDSSASTQAAAQASANWANQSNSLAASSATIATNLQAAVAAMTSLSLGNINVAPTPGVQAASSPFAATAPRTITPNVAPVAPAAGATNITVNQTIASNNPEQIARQLVPAINREIRRNASALRTA